ncbi:MAG: ATP-binding protein [Gammaproteobacteria bacterium]|nr:ATP-binding protein [Candidatus Brocadiales bacterium]MBL6998718.1 ATP-binding protein [Gammaproteobacteria bacterium]
MKLVFKQNHISITQFESIEISDFTVLTGVNGSGKSHLLGAIEQNKVVISGMEQARIVHFNYETFRLDNEPVFNAQQITAETEGAWQFYQQKIKPSTQSWRANVPANEYTTVKEECTASKKSFWNAGKERFKTYRDQAKNFFNNNNMKNQPQAQGVFSLVKQLPYSIDEIEHDDFTSQYKPYVFKNNFLPMQLGKVIWDYYAKHEKNQYYRYKNENGGSTHKVLTESEFIEVHGEKPWDLINKIMEKFDTLDYKVNSPEGMDYFGQFQLKLIHTKKPNLFLDFNSLSSGERILMALVASIYKSTSDNHFPDILLLDEVDASLHPSMMKNMLEVIQDIFLAHGIKIILVSHSPTTIALAPEDSIYIMNKSGLNRIEKKSKQSALSILTEGFATLNDIEPNLSIEYNISNTQLPVLFTEGVTDKILIESAWNKLHPVEPMPFYIQDCFDASFLANIFRRGYDGQDGIFVNYPDKILIALFDFDTEGYNSWNSLSKLSVSVESDPRKGLLKKNIEGNGFAMLLPVPDNSCIKSQVIKQGNETFLNKSVLSIELLFYGNESLAQYFSKESILGGGEIVVFKGKKREFAIKAREFEENMFKNFTSLFSQIKAAINKT